jgi:hypothetical protein
LISIGKFLINKSDIEINITVFLKNANDVLKNKNKILFLSLNDTIEIEYYISILNKIKLNKIKKYIILKDATASVLQHLTRIMGACDDNSFKICNLNSLSDWYDPYSYIIKSFISYYKITNTALLDRKKLKKIIMTSPYAATYKTSLEYYKKEINTVLNDEDIRIFKLFYMFINKQMENVLFKWPTKKIIDHFFSEKKSFIIESEEASSNLIYYHMKTKILDMTANNRITKKYQIQTNKVDHRKIKISIRANVIHFEDGMLCRNVNKNMDNAIITIHDCYMIDIFRISKLINCVNEQMNKKSILNFDNEHKKIYSIFILL